MLPKINRLKKKKDFERVFQRGKSFKDGFLILKIAKNNSEENRFGFIVSQKVSKKAVVRNKIRRRLSEYARQNIKNIKSGIDAVFIVLSGLEKKDSQELNENMNGLLKKSGLIK